MKSSLRVSEVAKITNRGTAVFFDDDPVPWSWEPHTVRITTPSGQEIETKAHVEFALRASKEEVMVLLISDLAPSDIPHGSEVTDLGPISGNQSKR